MEIFKSICVLFAGITVFLLGMKLLGEGLEKGAGKSVKKIFARIGNNRFAGVGIGAGTTAVIQSSSATTVMVVGFVNAGVMTLFQAVAIIMGANIGTTVTAYLGILGDLPVASVVMACGIAGIFMFMFSKNKKVACAGEIITGLAIIFVGMNFMGSAFKSSKQLSGAFENMFVSLAANPVGPLLLVLLGALFTGIIQSSSATTVMVVDMTLRGIIPVEAALFIVMGANIGTCVTALLAAIGTSVNAKRAAFIHLTFNIIGTLIFVPIIWLLKSQIITLLANMFQGNPGLQVAFFHTVFNVVTTLALLSFITLLCRLAVKVLPGKKGEELDEPKLYFINPNLTAAPSGTKAKGHPATITATANGAPAPDTSGNTAAAPLTDIELVMKETLNMAELAKENIESALRATFTTDSSQKNKIINTEQKINYINKGIGAYLVKLSKSKLSDDERKIFNSLHPVVSDIERIGDYAIEFLDETAEMKEHGIKFSAEAVAELEEMHQMVADLFAKSADALATRDALKLPEIAKLEQCIDEKKHALGFGHVSRLNAEKCSVEAGAHYYTIITGLEQIADHLTNIAFSIDNSGVTRLGEIKQISKTKTKTRSSKKNIYW